MYILKNSDGKYIARKNLSDFYAVSDIRKAEKFEDFKKATNVRKSLPKTVLDRDSYYVKTLDADIVKSVDVRWASNTAKEIESIRNAASLLSNKVSKIKETEDYCHTRLGEIKLELVDLNHYLEFNPISASDGYQKAKMIQDRLRERRELKDKLMEIDILRNLNIDESIVERFDGIPDRIYKPRRMPELFQ